MAAGESARGIAGRARGPGTQLGLLVAVGFVLAGLLAPPANAVFTPGRFVLKGRALTRGAGRGISVYRSPQAVTLEGCLTRKSRVRSGRGGVRLEATVRCGKRTLRLSARIRGRLLTGVAGSGTRIRRLRARRARP